jgi:hypothetical protein
MQATHLVDQVVQGKFTQVFREREEILCRSASASAVERGVTGGPTGSLSSARRAAPGGPASQGRSRCCRRALHRGDGEDTAVVGLVDLGQCAG